MAAKITAPHVIITEHPTSKPIRFRYKCEGRSAGTIPGEFSTSENKTYPSIRIVGYQGNAKVIVSCVTKEPPYRPHPHSLVGREGCHNGICTMNIPSTTMSITFSNLGIQCVRRKDIDQALQVRQNEAKIDPFNTGFDHRYDPASLDMNVLRLCFQVFIENAAGECVIPLTPVVSEPICDKKAMGNLVICRLSECTSPADGGRKDIYLLCKKVSKENIKVRFYEGDEHNPTWEGFPNFLPTQVHEQTAIWFTAPPYKNVDITEPVKVFIQLLRPTDGATSESLPFQFLPSDAEPGMLKRKRQKFGNDPRRLLLLELQNQLQNDAASYYNILPVPEQLPNLDLINGKSSVTTSEPFKFPTGSTDTYGNIPQNDKILNTNPNGNNYILSYVQKTEPSFLPYQDFMQPENTTSATFSQFTNPPVYNDLYENSMYEAEYINIPEPAISPSKFNTAYNEVGSSQHTNLVPCSSRQTSREKVNNAIRAKYKNKQNVQLLNNVPTYTNQLELRNEDTFANTNHMVLQSEMQNNFQARTTNTNFNNLLDVDFEQLENLLVPGEEDQYNSLNIPMNAMTISEVSCSLSSLLNMDSSQLPTTISSDQLDNLLAII